MTPTRWILRERWKSAKHNKILISIFYLLEVGIVVPVPAEPDAKPVKFIQKVALFKAYLFNRVAEVSAAVLF